MLYEVITDRRDPSFAKRSEHRTVALDRLAREPALLGLEATPFDRQTQPPHAHRRGEVEVTPYEDAAGYNNFYEFV